jgi:transcriptional regulator with XRE-family HTH domain
MTPGQPDEVTDEMIARALGKEIRCAREAGGWSRAQFVARLPSGIGDRTLVAYEHGARQLTVARLVELCRTFGVPAPTILDQALRKAQLELRNLLLRIDLTKLLNDTNDYFEPLQKWARNRRIDDPTGAVELSPATVRELAAFLGCSHADLARHLTNFSPT